MNVLFKIIRRGKMFLETGVTYDLCRRSEKNVVGNVRRNRKRIVFSAKSFLFCLEYSSVFYRVHLFFFCVDFSSFVSLLINVKITFYANS